MTDPGATRVAAPRARLAGGAVATVHAYLALTKPRVIELLLVTAVPALVLAAEGVPPLATAGVTLVAGALAAGGANALNCYLDRDIDEVMRRTRGRPLPRHRVSPSRALWFGIALCVLAVTLMATTTVLAAVLTAGAVLFYVFGYTLGLKRRTAHNVVWGGVAGCMPILIAWAAVTGGLSPTAGVLFLLVFFWTPAHTWALAWHFRRDYASAGVPMLPVVASPVRVARGIRAYSWATVAASLALWPLAGSWRYGVCAVALGGVLLGRAQRLLARARRDLAVRPLRMFGLTVTYLTLLCGALTLDALLP